MFLCLCKLHVAPQPARFCSRGFQLANLGRWLAAGILFLILEERVQREKRTLGASLLNVDFCSLVESETIFFLLLQNFHLIDFNVLTVTTIVLARRLIVAIVKEVKSDAHLRTILSSWAEREALCPFPKESQAASKPETRACFLIGRTGVSISHHCSWLSLPFCDHF